MIRIDFIRTLEVNQRLAAIQGVFIEEKWLNHDKNSEHCGVLTSLIYVSLKRFFNSLKN